MIKLLSEKTLFLFAPNSPEDADSSVVECIEVEKGGYYQIYLDNGTVDEAYIEAVTPITSDCDTLHVMNKDKTAQGTITTDKIKTLKRLF